MSLGKTFSAGLWRENPVFRLVLGLCPVLAVTSTATDALGMGLAVIFVLTSSNIVVSLMRPIVPVSVRIPIFIVVIASFVTVVQMVVAGYLPELNKSLGVFIPLIVVNCVILGRAEAFASKSQNSVVAAAADGLGMGIGFTLALVLLGSVREILGTGMWFKGLVSLGDWYEPILAFILPPGAFLVFGLILMGMNQLDERAKRLKRAERVEQSEVTHG
jgi:Na+-translocating ferredoxin:NAD+ oxidoreductase subunit E